MSKIKDSEGRIMNVGKDNLGKPGSGHSVCNKCGKDMLRCWDAVCAGCASTFCYEHVEAIGLDTKYWYCGNCKKRLWGDSGVQSAVDKLLNLSWDNIEPNPEEVEHIKDLIDNASKQNNLWGDWLADVHFPYLELEDGLERFRDE